MEYLGHTLAAIAQEKAGHPPQGVPVRGGGAAPEALAVIESCAQRGGRAAPGRGPRLLSWTAVRPVPGPAALAGRPRAGAARRRTSTTTPRWRSPAPTCSSARACRSARRPSAPGCADALAGTARAGLRASAAPPRRRAQRGRGGGAGGGARRRPLRGAARSTWCSGWCRTSRWSRCSGCSCPGARRPPSLPCRPRAAVPRPSYLSLARSLCPVVERRPLTGGGPGPGAAPGGPGRVGARCRVAVPRGRGEGAPRAHPVSPADGTTTHGAWRGAAPTLESRDLDASSPNARPRRAAHGRRGRRSGRSTGRRSTRWRRPTAGRW